MYKLSNLLFILFIVVPFSPFPWGKLLRICQDHQIDFDSEIGHQGDCQWKMIKAGDATDPGEKDFVINYATANWMPAIVPEQC